MIKPLNDYVLLEVETEERKIGSIIISSSNDKKKTNVARVVSMGIGKLIDNKRIPIALNVGDKVIYRDYSSLEYSENNKNYLLVQEEDIIAIIE